MASYKLPERLELREQLPRNPIGELLKREPRGRPASSSGPIYLLSYPAGEEAGG